MELKDALNHIRSALGTVQHSGQQFVYVPAFMQYLAELERDAPTITQATELQHQSSLAERKAMHEQNRDLFQAAIETGKTAITTCILVGGGGTAALLTFIGTLYAREGVAPVLLSFLESALISFATGVLVGAIASGLRYASQACFASHWRGFGYAFQIICILFVILSYLLFAYGIAQTNWAFSLA